MCVHVLKHPLLTAIHRGRGTIALDNFQTAAQALHKDLNDNWHKQSWIFMKADGWNCTHLFPLHYLDIAKSLKLVSMFCSYQTTDKHFFCAHMCITGPWVEIAGNDRLVGTCLQEEEFCSEQHWLSEDCQALVSSSYCGSETVPYHTDTAQQGRTEMMNQRQRNDEISLL